MELHTCKTEELNMRREKEVAIAKAGTVGYSIQQSSNEYLNSQIYRVLTSKFKKDAPEAFKAVEDAGYTIYKNGCSTWTIKNPHTKKYVWTSKEKYDYRRGTFRYFSYTDKQVVLSNKIDFVDCLKTPVNKPWHDIIWRPYHEVSPAVRTYENEIRSAKRMAASYREDIEQYKKQIAALQEKMVHAATRAAEYDAEVAEAKKKLGV